MGFHIETAVGIGVFQNETARDGAHWVLAGWRVERSRRVGVF